jgi:RNase P/RNase MRP subunit p29
MKKVLILVWMLSFAATSAFSAGPKAYQVTGKVLEVTPEMVKVEKGDDKWEIDRNAATVVKGDLKDGAKVTINYTMKAVHVEVKKEAKGASAGLKTYQVTGPILEVTKDMIVVEKEKERWEIGRDAATVVAGEMKVGAKVTIKYTMHATHIEVKDTKEKK